MPGYWLPAVEVNSITKVWNVYTPSSRASSTGGWLFGDSIVYEGTPGDKPDGQACLTPWLHRPHRLLADGLSQEV